MCVDVCVCVCVWGMGDKQNQNLTDLEKSKILTLFTTSYWQESGLCVQRLSSCSHSSPPSLSSPPPQSAQDKDAVEKVMNDLDSNNDGEVDFTEFIILMGALTVACNDFFQDVKKDDKPGEEEKKE